MAPPAAVVTAVAALTAGCSSDVSSPSAIASSTQPAPTALGPAGGAGTATATATPAPRTAGPSAPAVVDTTTMDGKLLMGYQGWLSCPSDGTATGWFHWFNANSPDAAHFRLDMYPEMSERSAFPSCGRRWPLQPMRYAGPGSVCVHALETSGESEAAPEGAASLLSR